MSLYALPRRIILCVVLLTALLSALPAAASQMAPTTTYAAYQRFERGAMIWREDTGDVLVLMQPGWQLAWFAEPNSLPDNPVLDPAPANLIKPVNAFGRIWGNYDHVRNVLGWALEPEVGYTTTFAPALYTAGGLAQTSVILPDGRQVLLRDDMTWGYAGEPRAIASLPANTTLPATLQPFEGGLMLYWPETGTIWVLKENGSAPFFLSTNYGMLPDNPIATQPPPGFLKPILGFGKVWGNVPAVREALGWATAPEQGYTMTFSRVTFMSSAAGRFVGLRVSLPGEQALIIYDNGTWTYD